MMDKPELDVLLQAWMRMVDCIAHDVKAPVASLRLENNGLKRILPKLLDGYQLAVQNNLIAPLAPEYLEVITTTSIDIENHVNRILDFLSLLRLYSQELRTKEGVSPRRLCAYIEEFLKNYPLSAEQRNKIHLDGRCDVQFQEEDFFVNYLLFNLMDTALFHIKKMGKGEIYIWIEEKDNGYALHFKDTAGALAENALAMVFNSFFVKQDEQTVPGLGFCRLKWLHLGGDIICDAVEGQYTEFTVKFPA